MTEESTPAQYLAEFVDGPLEGEFDTRALIGGAAEKRIAMVAAVDGLESTFWYNAVDERDVAGQLRVAYRFDAPVSDPVASDDENNEWSATV